MPEEIEEVERMTPAEVATILHMNAEGVRALLRQGKVEWGIAFQGSTGQWNYLIIKNKFYNWLKDNKSLERS